MAAQDAAGEDLRQVVYIREVVDRGHGGLASVASPASWPAPATDPRKRRVRRRSVLAERQRYCRVRGDGEARPTGPPRSLAVEAALAATRSPLNYRPP